MSDLNLDKSQAVSDDGDMPLMAHFAELRTRFIRIFLGVGVVFLSLVYFSRPLYDAISNPLVALLPDNASIIATQVVSGFLAPIKLAFFVAIFICVPFIVGQLWGFVSPALYKHEKRAVVPLLLSAIILFYVGVSFAYFVVLIPALKFLVLFAPDNVLPMTDIESYLDFVVKLFLAFGLMFEIPVATLLLVLLNIVSPKQLADKRRYIIVGCFFVSAIITPPDGASMLMLAIPMCILFEFGLLMAKMLKKPTTKEIV